jgi:hypothetical protein
MAAHFTINTFTLSSSCLLKIAALDIPVIIFSFFSNPVRYLVPVSQTGWAVILWTAWRVIDRRKGRLWFTIS